MHCIVNAKNAANWFVYFITSPNRNNGKKYHMISISSIESYKKLLHPLLALFSFTYDTYIPHVQQQVQHQDYK